MLAHVNACKIPAGNRLLCFVTVFFITASCSLLTVHFFMAVVLMLSIKDLLLLPLFGSEMSYADMKVVQ